MPHPMIKPEVVLELVEPFIKEEQRHHHKQDPFHKMLVRSILRQPPLVECLVQDEKYKSEYNGVDSVVEIPWVRFLQQNDEEKADIVHRLFVLEVLQVGEINEKYLKTDNGTNVVKSVELVFGQEQRRHLNGLEEVVREREEECEVPHEGLEVALPFYHYQEHGDHRKVCNGRYYYHHGLLCHRVTVFIDELL